MIYLDSSAIVKLIVAETHSDALREFLIGAELVSSELALAEVGRVAWSVRVGRRAAEQQAVRDRADAVLGGLAYVPVERDLLLAAAQIPPARVRTLDAIHVAAALTIAEDLEAFVTYDDRQRDAASNVELPVVTPGVDRI